MGFLIAPSEPPILRGMGTVSLVTERNGVDVLWAEKQVGGLIGVQRKEMSDLLASVGDGRLAKELHQMVNLKLAVLVVEGRPRWTTDGVLVHRFTRWTRGQHRSLLRSVQQRGVVVEFSDDLNDTCNLIREIAGWAHKADHKSLDRRPKPGPDKWGQRTNKAWAIHMLQSVEGLGPTQAEAIWDHFGGRIPIGLTCTEAELSQVKGLGPKRIKAIVTAFGGEYEGP